MASNSGQPGTSTTTTTSTTVTFTTNTRPQASSHTNNPSTSSSSRNLLPPSIHNRPPTPRTSNNNASSTEPFPGIPLEPTRTSELSQVHTVDHFPLTNSISTISLRAPSSSVSTHVRQRPIGIRRLPSQNVRSEVTSNETVPESGALSSTGRRRSTSAPQRPTLLETDRDGAPLQHAITTSSHLPPLVEEQVPSARQETQDQGQERQERTNATGGISRSRGGSQGLRRVSDAARSAVSRLSNRSDEPVQPATEYNDEIVDILDVLDPEVSTLTTLTNVQNSLFVPDLGRWLNRRPTYELTQGPSYRNQRPTLNRGTSKPLPTTPVPGPPPLKDVEIGVPSDIEEESESPSQDRRLSMAPSIASIVQEEHYAVLPHGMTLEGWSDEDKDLLDDHVRHMLHSKREGFKRTMRAFGKYVRKPLGFFVTLYAVLITLFGLAWVLFLIGWIYVGDRQSYIINVIDNVLVALFAIMGDGLAPFRAVDTYHMGFIAYYHHLTEKIRKKRELPKLQDHNELPEVHETEVDVEASKRDSDVEFSVLTVEQQKKLQHHQQKFAKSHSFYKPHETITHWAFPHHLFVAIVLLLDLHSCLQIALGACTWGISYHVRPAALTATILSCSITVNITAGIVIKIGDNKTRKKDVLKRMFLQDLTKEAMKKVEKQKEQGRESQNYNRASTQYHGEKVLPGSAIEGNQDNRSSSATVKYPPEVPKKIEA